jgi:hypothetical protein
MTTEQIVYGSLVWFIVTIITYTHCSWENIKECYGMLLTKEYWTSYNIVDASAWLAKAMIIIPGLIWGVQVWQLYWIALGTSVALIWSSYKRASPNVLAFNTIWCWISCMVLAQHLVK